MMIELHWSDLFLVASLTLFVGYNLGLLACGRKMFDSKPNTNLERSERSADALRDFVGNLRG